MPLPTNAITCLLHLVVTDVRTTPPSVVARFNKYRIPRENMLMRFSKVSRDGVFTKPPHAKVVLNVIEDTPSS